MIKPLRNLVLIAIENPDASEGGILLPEQVTEKTQQGRVVAVGKDARDTKVGALVLFAKYAGTKIKQGDEQFLLMKEDDIIAERPIE